METSAMAESLRRSKRNKFHLDVAAIHGHPAKKSRTEILSVVVEPDSGATTSSVDDEEGRRRRRSVPGRNVPGYMFQDDTDDDEELGRVGLEGTFMCTKCPARYESRPGLANHTKLHGGDKRKNACAVCDFSSETLKALRVHHRIHDRYGVLSQHPSPSDGVIPAAPQLVVAAPPPDTRSNSDTQSEDSLGWRCTSATPPRLSPAPKDLPTRRQHSLSPPRLQISAASAKEMRLRKQAALLLERFKKCDHCPFSVLSRKSMTRHVLAHERTSGYACTECSFKCETESTLRRHYELHKDVVVPAELVFVGEQKTAQSVQPLPPARKAKFEMPLHKGLLHTARKEGCNWVCNIVGCSFRTQYRPLIVTHKLRAHPVALPGIRYWCRECGAHFEKGTELRVHKLRMHQRYRHPNSRLFFLTEIIGHDFLMKNFAHRLKGSHKSVSSSTANTNTASSAATTTVTTSTSTPATTQSPASLEPSATSTSRSSDPTTTMTIKSETEIKTEELTRGSVESDASLLCSCPLCPQKAQNPVSMQRHMVKHQTKSELQCKSCSFSCRGLDVMMKHEQLHTMNDGDHSSQPPVLEPELPMEPKIEPIDDGYQTSVVVDDPSTQTTTLIVVALPAPAATMTTSQTTNGGASVESSLNKAVWLLQSQQAQMPLREAMKKWLSRGKRHSPHSQTTAANVISIRIVGDDGVTRRRCVHCPYETKFLGDLRTHRAMHSMNAKYRCTQCSYTSKRSVSLRQHIASHTRMNEKVAGIRIVDIVVNGQNVGEKRGHGFTRIYACHACPYVTSALTTFWRHARRHVNPPLQHTCTACTYSSALIEKMEDHQLLHPEGAAYIRPLHMESMMLVRDYMKMQAVNVESRTSLTSFGSTFKSKSFQLSGSATKTSPANSVSPVPARQPSERATKGKRNEQYQAVLNVGRSASESNLAAKEKEESIVSPLTLDVMHAVKQIKDDMNPWLNDAVKQYLNTERQAEKTLVCPECPYEDTNVTVFRLHRELHTGRRPHACNVCSYSSCTVEALSLHLNLHIPQLSPVTSLNRRKYLNKKRSHSHQPELIMPGASFYACPRCSYRTSSLMSFSNHTTNHALTLQQRLVTQMKRNQAQEDDSRRKEKLRRIPKKGDKDHVCIKCCFRCEVAETFTRHLEMHGQNTIYECRICDYSATTKNIVDFHESNHHVDVTMGLIEKKAAACPNEYKLKVPLVSDEQRLNMTAQELRCEQCDFICRNPPAMADHFYKMHSRADDDAKREAEFLSMGLFPTNVVYST